MSFRKSVREWLLIRWDNGCPKSEFQGVQNLIDYLWFRKTGSIRSMGTYLGTFTSFCIWARSSEWVQSRFDGRPRSAPEDFLSWSREDLEVLLQHYLDEMRSRSLRRGLSTRYANTSLGCLKQFFQVNGFSRENNKELRVRSYHQPARTRNIAQYVPTLSEACKMSDRCKNVRDRAIILTLFSTGLRNTALRALRIGDLAKEIDAGQENLLIKVEPEWNKRIPGACKGCIPYYTFTSVKATQAIKELLKRRREVFDCIAECEYLFISGGTQLRKRKALSIEDLENIVQDAAREAGVNRWKNVSPHALRKVFESVLRSPLIDGAGMDPKDQEFLMGHILSGSQDVYYDYGKIEKLRGQFAKLVFEDRMTPEQETLKTHKQVANILEIDVDKLKAEKEKALGRPLLVREELEMLKKAIKGKTSPLRGKREQKIVPKTELQTYLSNEWRFVANINEEMAIVENLSTKEDNAIDIAS